MSVQSRRHPPHRYRGGYHAELFTQRAPTPAELTCADETDPCNLPNAFVADPPLNKVVARTYEFGTRGRLPIGDGLRWNAGFFRTDLSDDILFTVVETGGAGFFRNVDATRRQGVEVGVQGRWKRLRYFGNYALHSSISSGNRFTPMGRT